MTALLLFYGSFAGGMITLAVWANRRAEREYRRHREALKDKSLAWYMEEARRR